MLLFCKVKAYLIDYTKIVSNTLRGGRHLCSIVRWRSMSRVEDEVVMVLDKGEK